MCIRDRYKIAKSLALSSEAIDFLTSCFQYDYNDRVSWEELKTHPFICTDTFTPFWFETFKENNSKVGEDKTHYILSSKVRYNFSSIYAKSKELMKKKAQEEKKQKEIEQKKLREVEQVRQEEAKVRLQEAKSTETNNTESSPENGKTAEDANSGKKSDTEEEINDDYVII
eukprot:TRINITY_DN2635_c0_g1_i15.p1 TRINITY_DN2635_c0_g1~~TRINITY_DN2635_c0_g1_i15.p1  ORF type:complete len:171 (-),score=44.64 TRINITY_DN2635_c0_g1_i15:121-633(-)